MVQEKELNNRRLFIHSLTSLFDQAILSALNLVVGLVLIRLATKETYGLYSQIYVVGIFVSTVAEALITSPLTTIAPGKTHIQRLQLFAQLHHLQFSLNILLALLFGIGSSIAVYVTDTDSQPWLIGIAFAFYIFLNAQREYLRSVSFIEGAPHKVLFIDSGYVIAVLCGVAILVLSRQLTVAGIMMMLGGANIIGLSLGKGILQTGQGKLTTKQQTISEIWQRGKWALPGALVAWLTNYSYLFLAAAFLGITAVADLNAARLLLMPISLCVLAW